MKVTKKPAEYTITLDQYDVDMLILATQYAYRYVNENPGIPRGNTRFAALEAELRGV